MVINVNYLISSTEELFREKNSKLKVLGIETSCDDTGCAIVDGKGNILGEDLKSQQDVHLQHGGVVPLLAKDLHKASIKDVVDNALHRANLKLEDVDAIAVTVKPGLPMSLVVGLEYGRQLAKTAKKPFIPIHHMEAHALTIRMVENIDFPYLVLLISGGHSLLAVAQSAIYFQLIGQSRDDAPGEVFDKAARRLNLHKIQEFSSICGGRSVEVAASRGNPDNFKFSVPMHAHRDCDFSFAGFKNRLNIITEAEEDKHGVSKDQIMPVQIIYDVCASLLQTVTKHICERLQRAIEFVKLKELIPEDRQNLVVAGGVASNKYIQRALGIVCRTMNYTVRVPPPHLCTDNGTMVAWNGVERLKANSGIHQYDSLDDLTVKNRVPLGVDLTRNVMETDIKCDWISLNELRNTTINQ